VGELSKSEKSRRTRNRRIALAVLALIGSGLCTQLPLSYAGPCAVLAKIAGLILGMS
jgi:hypothetical protein